MGKEQRDDLNIPNWAKSFLSIQTLITLSVGIAIAIGLFFLATTIDGVKTAFANWLNPQPQAEVTSSRTIVTGIRPLGQIVSVSVEVAKADIEVDVILGGLNLCSHSANHVAQGVVEAGIDITQVDDTDVSYDEATDTYTINLPAPSITSCRIEYIRQYDTSGGNPTCGIDWDNVRLLANYVATVDFAEDTLENGILERAENETTIVMQSFVNSLTGSDVVIEYAENGDTVSLPQSCNPQIPSGWELNTETDTWQPTD